MSMRKTRHPKRSYKRVIILGIILLVLLIAGAAAFLTEVCIAGVRRMQV